MSTANTFSCPHCKRNLSVTLTKPMAQEPRRNTRNVKRRHNTRNVNDDDVANDATLDDNPTYTFDTQDTPLTYTQSETEAQQHLSDWKTNAGSASQTVEARLTQLQKERVESQVDDTTSVVEPAVCKTNDGFATATKKHIEPEYPESTYTFKANLQSLFKPLTHAVRSLRFQFTDKNNAGSLTLTELAFAGTKTEPCVAMMDVAGSIDLMPFLSYFTHTDDGCTHLAVEPSADGTLKINATH